MIRKFLVLVSILLYNDIALSYPNVSRGWKSGERLVLLPDTSREKDLTAEELANFRNLRKSISSVDTIDLKKVNVKPFTNLSEFFKGQVSGVYVQQPSGETGSYQNIIVRGAGSTLFSNADINQVRPTVFVNGVPMVTNHSFAYGLSFTNTTVSVLRQTF